MRPRSVIYLICSLAIILAVVGAWFAFRRESAGNGRLTNEVAATIENVEVRRAVSPIFGNEYTIDVSVRYKYRIDSQEYHQTTILTSAEAEPFTPWGFAKVCFDPGNDATVERGKLFPKNHRCGS